MLGRVVPGGAAYHPDFTPSNSGTGCAQNCNFFGTYATRLRTLAAPYFTAWRSPEGRNTALWMSFASRAPRCPCQALAAPAVRPITPADVRGRLTLASAPRFVVTFTAPGPV